MTFFITKALIGLLKTFLLVASFMAVIEINWLIKKKFNDTDSIHDEDIQPNL